MYRIFFPIILKRTRVNLSLRCCNLHVPSVTQKSHSVTLQVTWVHNYQTILVSLLDWRGKQNH